MADSTSLLKIFSLRCLANIFIFSAKEFCSQTLSGRSNRIGVNFVRWAIQTLWERSGSSSSQKKDLRPSAIVHIDANVEPKVWLNPGTFKFELMTLN